ncbi:MAG TPA: ATP-binding protein [Clostridiaceae bacterium]
MKKKMILFMILILIFSMAVISTIFIVQVNQQYAENLKENLNINNNIIINLIKDQDAVDSEIYLNNNYKNPAIRLTVINPNGSVLYDSIKDFETMDNHNNREEIIEARTKGQGSSIRLSKTLDIKMLYFAKAYKDGYIVRSSIPLTVIFGFETNFIKNYLLGAFIVFAISLLLLSKLTNYIVNPIKDLEYVTSRVAKGELDQRAKITSTDEIGQLGKTFNDMANKLEVTLNDAIDKQTRLEAILKSMDSGVIAIDINKKIIMINPYAEKIFGIRKSVIGKSLLEAIRNYELEDIFESSNDEYKEIKVFWPKEKELRIKIAEIIYNNCQIGSVAVLQDITDIKKLENIRSQFVTNVTHELKTPLTSIMGFAETLRYVDDAETKVKFLDIINEESERLTRLINDILILSDIENNKEIYIEDVDVEDMTKSIVNLMKNTAEVKNIELLLSIKGNPIIKTSKDRFKQMLINLVDNAIKYTEKGSVEIDVCEIDNKCLIQVKDSGLGIAKDQLPRLFERFYRVDKARSRSQGGTGLGLAIVKHIVMSLNGTIEVESTLGIGSTFKITIPM